MTEPIIAIAGPTASGKTELAVRLAAVLEGEILSADSRQVFRGMNIGTGKDLRSYILNDGTCISYHLIDILDAGDSIDVFRWQTAFNEAYQSVIKKHKRAFLVGGSGLYLETALKGVALSKAPINPALRTELEEHLSAEDLCHILARFHKERSVADPHNMRRLVRSIEIATYEANHEEDSKLQNAPLPHILLLIDIPKEERIVRIHNRLQSRVEEGLIDEVENLIKNKVPVQTLINYGLEYRYITQYLIGELTKEEALRLLEIAIRQFAKRQMTWFRGMERRGFTLHPINGLQSLDEQVNEALEIIKRYDSFYKENNIRFIKHIEQ